MVMGDDLYEDKDLTKEAWWKKPLQVLSEGDGMNADDWMRAAGHHLSERTFVTNEKVVYHGFNHGGKRPLRAQVEKLIAEVGGRNIFSESGNENYDVFIWPGGTIKLSPGNGRTEEEPDWDDDEEMVVDEPPTIAELAPEPDDHVEGSIISVDGTTERLIAILDAHQPTPRPMPKPRGQAYVLVDLDRDGIQVMPIGLGGQALLRENYESKVLKQFDSAVDDLQAEKPKGRLIILDGPPGTGKTYMVRAFMTACPESKFVVIPPHMVKGLADPKLILTFIREIYNKHSRAPLVLILEDADQCLSKRKAENMASISAILNLSDGIIGSLLDMRILATTNTPAQEFDEALLRKGRMSAHIRVGALTDEMIQNIWTRLAGEKNKVPVELLANVRPANPSIPRVEHSVLADVYAEYNELSEVDKALGDLDKLKM